MRRRRQLHLDLRPRLDLDNLVANLDVEFILVDGAFASLHVTRFLRLIHTRATSREGDQKKGVVACVKLGHVCHATRHAWSSVTRPKKREETEKEEEKYLIRQKTWHARSDAHNQ